MMPLLARDDRSVVGAGAGVSPGAARAGAARSRAAAGMTRNLSMGNISLRLYQEMDTHAPFPLRRRLSADIVRPTTEFGRCCGFVLKVSPWPMTTTCS